MNTILNRLSEIENFPTVDDSKWIDREQACQVIGQVESKIENGILKKKGIYDISDMEFEEAKDILLSNQSLYHNDEVLVIWGFEKFGVVIPYKVFCHFFDDLWYPSSDDVLVTDESMNNCVGISHEEIITFWSA